MQAFENGFSSIQMLMGLAQPFFRGGRQFRSDLGGDRGKQLRVDVGSQVFLENVECLFVRL